MATRNTYTKRTVFAGSFPLNPNKPIPTTLLKACPGCSFDQQKDKNGYDKVFYLEDFFEIIKMPTETYVAVRDNIKLKMTDYHAFRVVQCLFNQLYMHYLIPGDVNDSYNFVYEATNVVYQFCYRAHGEIICKTRVNILVDEDRASDYKHLIRIIEHNIDIITPEWLIAFVNNYVHDDMRELIKQGIKSNTPQ